MWHQHFDLADDPARYMAISFGSIRYPFSKEKTDVLHRTYTVKSTFQIDYEDEEPWIRKVFEEEQGQAFGWDVGDCRRGVVRAASRRRLIVNS